MLTFGHRYRSTCGNGTCVISKHFVEMRNSLEVFFFYFVLSFLFGSYRHYHSMEVFATFNIFNNTGHRVAEGHKASFCLEDNQCMPGTKPKYACANFGDQGNLFFISTSKMTKTLIIIFIAFQRYYGQLFGYISLQHRLSMGRHHGNGYRNLYN